MKNQKINFNQTLTTFIKSSMLFIILTLSLNSCYMDNNNPVVNDPDLNRFVTYNYSIKANDWAPKVNDISTYLYLKTIPDLTTGVINNGIVLTYLRSSSGTNTWVQLPMTNYYTDSKGVPYTIEYLPWHGVGQFELQYVDSHPNPVAPSFDMEIRVVIIEGKNYTTIIKKLDKSNYNLISNKLNELENQRNHSDK